MVDPVQYKIKFMVFNLNVALRKVGFAILAKKTYPINLMSFYLFYLK